MPAGNHGCEGCETVNDFNHCKKCIDLEQPDVQNDTNKKYNENSLHILS